MQSFVYNALPARVIFGFGTQTQISEEIKTLGCKKALVLTGPRQAEHGRAVLEQLGTLGVGIYTNATMHTPVEVTEDAMTLVHSTGADCVVSLGGGSTIGLGKAIALRTDLPQIVIPTTYAGSEATPIIGQTQDGIKTTQKTLRVLPKVIIYDVNLTLSLPTALSVASGINAIAHAVETLYAKDGNPIMDLLAQEGIRNIAQALPTIAKGKVDDTNLQLEARSKALYGAWACSTVSGVVSMSLHHKLCHTLGGTFKLPHAETHTVILPHAIAYNAPFAPEAIKKVASSLGATNAAQHIYDLAKSLGAPCSLRELGMKEEDLERAADLAVKNPYPNPAPLERGKLLRLLRDAWAGTRPE